MNNLIKLKCQNLSFIMAGFLLQDRGQAIFSALPQKCMMHELHEMHEPAALLSKKKYIVFNQLHIYSYSDRSTTGF